MRRHRFRWMGVAAFVVPLLVACVGRPPPAGVSTTAGPSPGCAPTTTNELSAVSLSFDRPCLAVPAHAASTLFFANDDGGESHNVGIYPVDSCMAKAARAGIQPICESPFDPALFRGQVIVGVAQITYQLPELWPGRYVFLCEFHAYMHGTFRVS